LQRVDERWKVLRDGIPQNIVVHEVIAMDESIPHADDLELRDVGIPLLGCPRHLARSLAYEFD